MSWRRLTRARQRLPLAVEAGAGTVKAGAPPARGGRCLLVHARLAALAFLCVAALISPCAAHAADRLVLRNLDFVLDRTVVEMDEDGVRLDAVRADGSDRLTWDRIERGTVALDQPRFDKLLRELGPPLYRIRQRLKTGDYEGLLAPAEQVYPQLAPRRSLTAYMVCQALMWARLSSGKREAAVEPYLRACELLRSGAIRAADLPGERRLAIDPATGLSSELTPVWFDAAAAKAALPGVQQAIRGMTQPRPEGVYVYYATLALAAGEPAEAERVLASLRTSEPVLAQWRDVILAQREVQAGAPGAAVATLQSQRGELVDACRPAALYWLGQAQLQSAEAGTVSDGLLDLLTLPAEYATRDRELAAAGLYQAAAALDKLKDASGAAALRQELARQYGGTHHANLLMKPEARNPKSETNPKHQ
jgi:hypothetical protein